MNGIKFGRKSFPVQSATALMTNMYLRPEKTHKITSANKRFDKNYLEFKGK